LKEAVAIKKAAVVFKFAPPQLAEELVNEVYAMAQHKS
jgi:hypothetical protein